MREVCVECAQRCRSVHGKRKNSSTVPSSFFKVMMGDDFSKILYLPPKFGPTASALVHKEAIIEDSNGQQWRVEVSIVNKSFAFQEGWNTFSLKHGLQVGNFLVFNYVGRSHFVVKIYDEYGCEKIDFPKRQNQKKRCRSKTKIDARDDMLNRQGLYLESDMEKTQSQDKSLSVEFVEDIEESNSSTEMEIVSEEGSKENVRGEDGLLEQAMNFSASKVKRKRPRKHSPTKKAKGRKKKVVCEEIEEEEEEEEVCGKEYANPGDDGLGMPTDFWDAEIALRFSKYFKKRSIASGRIVDFKKLDEAGCNIEKFFDDVHWSPLLKVKEVVFEDLVRKFYANLRVLRDGSALESLVNGKKIVLSEGNLAKIIGIPTEGSSIFFKSIWIKDFPLSYEQVKEQLVERHDLLQPRKFNALALNFERRVMAHIIATCVMPRVRSLELLNKREVYMLYCVVNKIPINLPLWIIKYMVESGTSNEPAASLPYGMLLTKIFRANKVDLTKCLFKEVESTYDATSLKLMKNKYKTTNSNLTTSSALEPSEVFVNQYTSEPTFASSSKSVKPTILQALNDINNSLQKITSKLDDDLNI